MRGDLVTISVQGDFGKSRPALIIQTNHFATHPTLTVLLITSTLIEAPLFRITVYPDDENRLQAPSQVMVDKVMTIRRDKAAPAFGRIAENTMVEIDRALAIFLGIAK
ncbi:type II toxin-antitoxin system PemK/MazF family toxin [Pollutimonas sp. M17]|uniref:type II toxin-antitoxin system PemK/MazF family toxin n=1 Tax=Pollutimonas sp. M17 TaxID=2962065 RepID=UPI0021F4ACDE|nr:type II toxin-antitoxin system PemK/MazF family toxin [Pollutimonas sp. M17]UYO94966.1 type II toxin-antitoxin system PemK/MazF family toxin [Pollutimonas sp. M17]